MELTVASQPDIANKNLPEVNATTLAILLAVKAKPASTAADVAIALNRMAIPEPTASQITQSLYRCKGKKWFIADGTGRKGNPFLYRLSNLGEEIMSVNLERFSIIAARGRSIQGKPVIQAVPKVAPYRRPKSATAQQETALDTATDGQAAVKVR